MYNIQGICFELIAGPMSCGKTEELLRRLRRAKIANKKVKIFSPAVDTRSKRNHIESRNGLTQLAIIVKSAREILDYIDEDTQVVGIDELQFYDPDIINIVKILINKNIKVVASGLDLDFKGEPFGVMPVALALADRVDKLTAICMSCGSEYACRTQRLIDGKPADKNSPLIMVGGDDTYEARCLNCYVLPDESEELIEEEQLVACLTA
ncbi:MAG: thymidine kinase [Cyanobacteriota bacterium]